MDKHNKHSMCPKGGPHQWVATADPGVMACSKCKATKKVPTKGKHHGAPVDDAAGAPASK